MKIIRIIILIILCLFLSLIVANAQVVTSNMDQGWYGYHGGELTRIGDYFRWEIEQEPAELIIIAHSEAFGKDPDYQKVVKIDEKIDLEFPRSGLLCIFLNEDSKDPHAVIFNLDNITLEKICIRIGYIQGKYILTNENANPEQSNFVFSFTKTLDEILSECSGFIFIHHDLETTMKME